MALNHARTRWLKGFVAVMFVGLAVVAAIATSAPTVIATKEHEKYGTFLVDAEGASLYAYVADEPDVVLCTDECATMWPPLLARAGEVAAQGDELDPGLIGTVRRPDGEIQVSYAGAPLYRSAHDRSPGDVLGHGVEGLWHLVGASGNRIDAEDSPTDERMRLGERIYLAHCAECHGTHGDERVDPRAVTLAGNERAVGDARRVARQIVRGGGFMPGFGRQLSNEEVAAVATYVRNAWGNAYGVVTREDAERSR